VLESESIHILREVAAECRNPVLLFSRGKDSVVLLRLAEKAFRPARFPFPLMHIDTEHNFPEVVAFRDRRAAELGERLIVRSVQDSINQGRVVLRSPQESRNVHQSVTLLDAITEFGFDACIAKEERLAGAVNLLRAQARGHDRLTGERFVITSKESRRERWIRMEKPTSAA
jgi:sulfate adenylyltransferase subunit 2